MQMKMTPLRIKVDPLAGYLITLAMYSGFMCLNTIHHLQQQEQVQQEQSVGQEIIDDDNPGGGIVKIRRHARSLDHPKFRVVDDFYNRLMSPETSCRKMIQLGGTSCRTAVDYDKSVCLDPDVALIPKDCTVYSFGIGHDSTFDDMAHYFGCEVFMFDPTINENDVKVHLLKKESFYHLGLDIKHHSIQHQISYIDQNNEAETIDGEYETYDKIRERIGHQNKTVHYLKIDIENTEWDIIPYMASKGLFSGILQLAIEIHTMDIIKLPQNKVLGQLEEYWKILGELNKQGFQRVYYRPNVVFDTLYHVPGENRTIPTCAEILYIRRGSPR